MALGNGTSLKRGPDPYAQMCGVLPLGFFWEVPSEGVVKAPKVRGKNSPSFDNSNQERTKVSFQTKKHLFQI